MLLNLVHIIATVIIIIIVKLSIYSSTISTILGTVMLLCSQKSNLLFKSISEYMYIY